MSKRVPNKLAAEILGVSITMMFWQMQQGLIDIGTVITPEQSGMKHHKYYVYEDKLYKHIGKENKDEQILEARTG